MRPIAVDTNRLKFEQTFYDTRPTPPTQGLFSRGLGALGLATQVGAGVASFFFPPAAIIAAGGFGLHTMSNYAGQTRAANKAVEAMPQEPVQAFYPGTEQYNANYLNAPSGNSPVPGAVDVEVMDILTAKQGTMTQAAQQIGAP